MRKIKRVLRLKESIGCLLMLMFFISNLVLAIDCRIAYAGDPIAKLGRGLANTTTGLLEVPKEIKRQIEKSGDVAAFFVGPLKGLAKGIGRTLVGVYDIVTFLVPIPRNYEPVIEPEYVFEGHKRD